MRTRLDREYHQEKGREKARECRPLHLAGCMLYWAEGGKRQGNISFINSDPNMLLLFMRFLREEMSVEDEIIKMTIQCYTHDAAEIREIENYWLNLFRLPSSSLNKTQFKNGNIAAVRHNNFENGYCCISVYRKALLHQIFGAIQEYAGFENSEWMEI